MLFERWRQEGLLERYKGTDTLILHTEREAAGHTDHWNHITSNVNVLQLMYKSKWVVSEHSHFIKETKNPKQPCQKNLSFSSECLIPYNSDGAKHEYCVWTSEDSHLFI